MAEYRKEWKFEIEDIFLSDNLEEIVDGTRLFFRKMNLDAGYEQEKIGYWLSCAYRHEEVGRTPFFPILFLYAVCENERFSQEKITRYMKYAVRYIYESDGELENELRNGWLRNHLDGLPQEHRKVARIYQEVADCLYLEEEESEVGETDTEGAAGIRQSNSQVDAGWNSQEDRSWSSRSGNSWDSQEDDNRNSQNGNRQKDTDEKKSSSQKGLLIGLVAGVLIGITLGCTGTAFILNKYQNIEEQKNASASSTPFNSASVQTSSSPADSAPSKVNSSDASPEDSKPLESASSASDASDSVPGAGDSNSAESSPSSSADSGSASAPEGSSLDSSSDGSAQGTGGDEKKMNENEGSQEENSSQKNTMASD